MNLLRRKSTSGSKRNLSESSLLRDVQDCCSRANQKGKDPDEATMGRAITRLTETTNPDEYEIVIKFLGNELKNEAHQVVMLTLGTIGYLMRTDCPEFQRMLSKSPYILKQMGVIIEYRRKAGARTEQYEQADRCLALIQSWAEILGGANGTSEILEMYRQLKRKEWVQWPPRVHGYDPVNGPMYSRDAVSADPEAPKPPRKPASFRPSSMRTFSSEETSWLRKDFDHFDQMLTTLEGELNRCKDSKELAQNDLIPDLVSACDKIGPQLRSMIEIVSATHGEDLDSLAPLLEMNDRLLKLIEKHEKISATSPQMKNRDQNLLDLDDSSFSKQQTPVAAAKSTESYNPFEDESVMAQVFGADSYRDMMVASNASRSAPLSMYKSQPSPAQLAPPSTSSVIRPPQRQAPTPLLRTAPSVPSSQPQATSFAPPSSAYIGGYPDDEIDIL